MIFIICQVFTFLIDKPEENETTLVYFTNI